METSLHMEKMSRLLLQLVIVVGMISVAIAVLRWFLIDDPSWLPPTVATYLQSEPLTLKHRLAGLFIEMIPLAAALYTLGMLSLICTAYRRGVIFSRETGTNYRKFGSGLVLLAAANGLYTALLTATFSLLDGSRQLVLALGLSTADLYLLVVGFAVVMLGSVMDEAYRINDENAQIV